jgi:PKD repeat protein
LEKHKNFYSKINIMKPLVYFLSSVITLSFLFISCEKEDEIPAPVASFTMSKTSAFVGETISFINASENAVSYSWNFGDGNASTEKSPTHSFASEGNYTVTLTVKGDGGENSATKTIKVTYPAPVAGFTMDKTKAETGETITFTNTSQNASTYSWNFGDGKTSTEKDPKHAYLSKGTYNVELKAIGEGGEQKATRSIEIVSPPSLAGTWKGSSGTSLVVNYAMNDNNGSLSGMIMIFRIQTGMISNLPYSTSGTYNKDTGQVKFQTTSGMNFKYEFSGTFDGNNKIVGNIKATNMTSVSLTLTKEK